MNDTRINKLREYLFGIINQLTTNRNYQISADMLSTNIDDYSLDKIPTGSELESWIIGGGVKRDVFSFRSRKLYGKDLTNLSNIGFFERFEEIIKSNNEAGVLPEIDGIETIQCLSPGTLNSTNGTTAEFNIQIQITYRDDDKYEIPSL